MDAFLNAFFTTGMARLFNDQKQNNQNTENANPHSERRSSKVAKLTAQDCVGLKDHHLLIAKQEAVCLHVNGALWQDGMLRDRDLLTVLCKEEH